MVKKRAQQARWMLLGTGLIAMLVLVACSGPDEFGSASTTQTPTVEPSPTPSPELEPTVSPDDDPSPTVTSDDNVTPTPDIDPEPSPTATTEPTPEPEPTATEEPEPSPTAQPISPMEALPQLEELTEGGYVVAAQGDRTAEQLAGAYADSEAHLMRLEEWGFQQHVFREFTRTATGPDDPLPTYVLATVNVYGSVEQADLALQWLERFQTNQGQALAEAPDVGDAAVALTVTTAQGDPSASLYIRMEERIYIYYGQGGDPLPEVIAVAERVFERLNNQAQIAKIEWSI